MKIVGIAVEGEWGTKQGCAVLLGFGVAASAQACPHPKRSVQNLPSLLFLLSKTFPQIVRIAPFP
jgi:hypothetical protein